MPAAWKCARCKCAFTSAPAYETQHLNNPTCGEACGLYSRICTGCWEPQLRDAVVLQMWLDLDHLRQHQERVPLPSLPSGAKP